MNKNIIIDVRSEDEFKRERIKGSIDLPLSFIETREDRVAKLLTWKKVTLMCRTWRRAELAKQILSPHMEIENIEVFEWGILEYKKQFPESIISEKLQSSIPIMRQVQIAAGFLILAFSLLWFFVHIYFFFGALFVWGGLFYAGLSGNCMMATILWKLPFNK